MGLPYGGPVFCLEEMIDLAQVTVNGVSSNTLTKKRRSFST